MATDTHWINGAAEPLILFGPFRLLPKQRLLIQADEPVHLGSRAFDVLIALLGRPGELISKDELMAAVWPDTFVGRANLAVHISALRRALCDGRDGNRYVVNIPGRGYRFVAPVTIVQQRPRPAPSAMAAGHSSPWPRPPRSVACDPPRDETAQFGCRLTFIDPGGGKTAITLALEPEMIGGQQDRVWVVNLNSVEDQ